MNSNGASSVFIKYHILEDGSVAWSLLWSRLKYLNSDSTDFHNPLTFHLLPPAGQSIHLAAKISPQSIGAKSGEDISGSQVMNPNELCRLSDL